MEGVGSAEHLAREGQGVLGFPVSSAPWAAAEHSVWGTWPGGLVALGFGTWTVTESPQNIAFPAKLILNSFRGQARYP